MSERAINCSNTSRVCAEKAAEHRPGTPWRLRHSLPLLYLVVARDFAPQRKHELPSDVVGEKGLVLQAARRLPHVGKANAPAVAPTLRPVLVQGLARRQSPESCVTREYTTQAVRGKPACFARTAF